MFKAISKIISLLSSISLMILLALLLYGTIFTYNMGIVISDRQNLKDWMTQDEVKMAYVDYVVENSYSALSAPLAETIDEENIKRILSKQLEGDMLDNMIDTTVNNVYDWLEGKPSPIEVDTSEEAVIEDLDFVDEMYGDKLGILSGIINPTDILKLVDRLNIIDLEQLSAGNFPYLYQFVLSLPKKLLIVCGILAVLLMISRRSWRWGFFMIGISLILMPVYTLFLYKYIPIKTFIDTQEMLENANLEAIQEIPEFMTLIGQAAVRDIMEPTNKYALFMLGAGIVLILISQLAIKERTTEDPSEKESGSSMY